MKDYIPKKEGIDLHAGIYNIKIIGGKYIANKEVNIIVTVYHNDLKVKNVTLNFPIPQAHWLFNKLCLACRLDNRKKPIHIFPDKTHKGLVGEYLYMLLHLYREVDENGEIIHEKVEPFNFFPDYHAGPPSVMGDPKHDNNNASGIFLKEIVVKSDKEKADYTVMPEPIPLMDE